MVRLCDEHEVAVAQIVDQTRVACKIAAARATALVNKLFA
jgi:hypothetical protein